MNYEEAKQKLGAYGQEHALQYWDELSDKRQRGASGEGRHQPAEGNGTSRN